MVDFLVGKDVSRLDIEVDHEVKVPIGAGFGASAAGTLSAAIALADSLDLGLTMNQIAMAAHRAEVVSHTGLGTVPALVQGGFVIVRKPGGPGISVIDRIPMSEDFRIVACHFGPISTATALKMKGLRARVNPLGRRTLARILANPTPTVFMRESHAFAERLGLLSGHARMAMSLSLQQGAVGAAQNMLGDAVHVLIERDLVARLVGRLRRTFPQALVFSSAIEQGGARLL